MLACSLISISSRGSSFSVTFSAVDGSAWVRFEWNLTFLSTFSTDSIVHLSWSTIRHSFRTSNSPKELVLKNTNSGISTTTLLINSYARS